jgi:hypothetical protein
MMQNIGKSVMQRRQRCVTLGELLLPRPRISRCAAQQHPVRAAAWVAQQRARRERRTEDLLALTPLFTPPIFFHRRTQGITERE